MYEGKLMSMHNDIPNEHVTSSFITVTHKMSFVSKTIYEQTKLRRIHFCNEPRLGLTTLCILTTYYLRMFILAIPK
jgi:hypothetical protein